MSSASSSSSKLTLKLFIDTNRDKVLFAEASKPVIDFLFSFLCFPVGVVVGFLKKGQMVGCIANLYKSVENLDETYMQPNKHKGLLLRPRPFISLSQISDLLSSVDDSSCAAALFYRCPNHYNHVTCDNRTPCPENCELNMYAKLSLAGGNPKDRFAGGFVEEVVSYMVMDDLVIQPMSTISSITLLNKFNVTEVRALQEKVVVWDTNKGVNILKASLKSKTVLTDVFLKNETST